MHLDEVLSLDADLRLNDSPGLRAVAEQVIEARRQDRPVIAKLGAHVIKTGLSRYVIDLLERGVLTHVAVNGACAIHDYELALVGATTESVARYIQEGQFGLWSETGQINEIVRTGAAEGLGFGEAVGQAIEEGDYPHKEVSVFAAGYRLGVPVTVHVGLGYDIIHEHPNCDGAALGQASYHDFLIFAESVRGLQGGVLLNFGSAIMGPEVYLKALSMARNVSRHEGHLPRNLTTAVFDLVGLPPGWRDGPPAKDHPQYYYRPWKTILVRTVADGGTSFYFGGDHRQTVPTLWARLVRGAA